MSNIYEVAGLNQSDIDEMKMSLESLIGDNASTETVIRRGVERYDRDAFVVGLLIGMELREINGELVGREQAAEAELK